MDTSISPTFDGIDRPGIPLHQELRDHIETDASFPTTYLRAVSAVAASDGMLNIADFKALDNVFDLLNDSALAQVVLLESLERPLPWKAAFRSLRNSSQGISREAGAMAFEAARPLLLLQGLRSRELAQAFGAALQYQLGPMELAEFPADESGLWGRVSTGSVRLVTGRKYADLADLCVRATGDLVLARAVLDCEAGAVDHSELSRRMSIAAVAVDRELGDFDARIADFEDSKALSGSFVASVELLRQQVRQRLAIADARIEFERRSFDEDLEECIVDAGNAFTRDVVERLATDAWKRPMVWESIAKSTFGKELERRLNRIITRREESLGLIRQDLQLFQEELVLSRKMIWKRMHHTQLAASAPGLRWGTRLKNSVETVATTTLWAGGGLGVAGAGAAYFLGGAVLMPVVAPALPVIGGVLLVAGAIKWLMNPAERKTAEIEHQRARFEKAFREQLEIARSELMRQLETTAQAFHQTAEQLVLPIVLEAQAADRLASLKLKVARRLCDHTRKALVQMCAAIRG